MNFLWRIKSIEQMYVTKARGRRPQEKPVDRINEELREMYIRETEHR